MRNKMDKIGFNAVGSRYNQARRWMISPVSRQSRYALDCLNFLVASVQIGLGTFVAFYLASLGWSKERVGLALASGQTAGVLGQIPGGATVDAVPRCFPLSVKISERANRRVLHFRLPV